MYQSLEKRLNERPDVQIPTYIESLPSEEDLHAQKSFINSTAMLSSHESPEPKSPGIASSTGEFVTFSIFQKQSQQLQNVKDNMKVLRAKIFEVESKSMTTKKSPLVSATLNKNDGPALEQLQQEIDDRLNEVELLKEEMKRELKRLQKQDVAMHSQFDKVFQKIQEL